MSDSLKRLHEPPVKPAGRNPLLGREPMLDSREAAAMAPPQASKAETHAVHKPQAPKEGKRLTAREYASILSAVILFTSLLSQGAAIIGCAKTVIDQKVEGAQSSQTVAPAVSQRAPANDMASNVSLMPIQTAATAQASAQATTKKLNDQNLNASIAPLPPKASDPNLNVSIPSVYLNYSMP